jgi:SAM-dependent methyltransferase
MADSNWLIKQLLLRVFSVYTEMFSCIYRRKRHESRKIGGIVVHSRWYDIFMLPFERRGLASLRRQLVGELNGSVLEIGGGSGANLRHVDSQPISHYRFTDRKIHRDLVLPEADFSLSITEADVQGLPFDDASFDCVLSTLVFCSVPDPARGLDEIFRVLKPGGTFLFMEHIRPESPMGSRLADAITPLWKAISDGCHLNRDTLDLMRQRGFTLRRILPRKLGVFYAGIAERPC